MWICKTKDEKKKVFLRLLEVFVVCLLLVGCIDPTPLARLNETDPYYGMSYSLEPKNVIAVPGSRSVYLSWIYLSISSSDWIGLEISWEPTDGQSQPTYIRSYSLLDTIIIGLNPETNYTFSLKALYEEDIISEEVTAETKTLGENDWESGTFPYDVDSMETNFAVAEEGIIYIASGEYIYAYTIDGTEEWAFNIDPYYQGYTSSARPVIGREGTIFIASGDTDVINQGQEDEEFIIENRLFALHDDGTKYWETAVDYDSLFCDPAVFSDGCIAVAAAGFIDVLNPDGTLVRRITINSAPLAPPAIGPGDIIYIPCCDGKIHAYNRATGNESWSCVVAASVTQPEKKEWSPVSHIALGDTAIYICTEEGLVAVDYSGHIKWELPLDLLTEYEFGYYNRGITSPVIGPEEIILFSCIIDMGIIDLEFSEHESEPMIIAVESDGTEKWRSGYGIKDPAVSQNSLLMGGMANALWAFDLETGVPQWYHEGVSGNSEHIKMDSNGYLYFLLADRSSQEGTIQINNSGEFTPADSSWPMSGGDAANTNCLHE